MSGPTVAFRFPVSDSISWALWIALPAAVINGAFVYFARPDLGFAFVFEITLGLVGIILPLAVLALRATLFSISKEGVRGWPYKGVRGVTVPWSNIKRVNRVLAGMEIPCIYISSEDITDGCSVPTVIARLPEYRAAVMQYVEPSHCLAKELENVT